MSNSDFELDRAGRSVLHYASLKGDDGEVRRLLAMGLAPDLPDKAGFTPLHFAAQGWSAGAAQALLNAGAGVDPKNKFGNTPLGVAVVNSKGRGELISILREAGADPLLENYSGNSPLSLARKIANYDIRQFFGDMG